ncbi:phage tail fiber protein [Pelotomaculum propionicicum]|uniref:phage tail fiber protein n=1 Tax=Pelotomaculum propionicicum TaxID=258475 RepID=UPI003B81E6F3
MPFTTATANKILDKILRGVDFTPATNLYISLHTADSGDNGANEVTGGSYARQAITFNAANSKHADNPSQIEFAGMPACTITHVGLWSASTLGDFWWGGDLTASKTLNAGDTLRFPAADVDVNLV